MLLLDPVNDTETKPQKRVRKLKPEVAARFREYRTSDKIRKLYERPVDELSPEEIAQMRVAFFRK